MPEYMDTRKPIDKFTDNLAGWTQRRWKNQTQSIKQFPQTAASAVESFTARNARPAAPAPTGDGRGFQEHLTDKLGEFTRRAWGERPSTVVPTYPTKVGPVPPLPEPPTVVGATPPTQVGPLPIQPQPAPFQWPQAPGPQPVQGGSLFSGSPMRPQPVSLPSPFQGNPGALPQPGTLPPAAQAQNQRIDNINTVLAQNPGIQEQYDRNRANESRVVPPYQSPFAVSSNDAQAQQLYKSNGIMRNQTVGGAFGTIGATPQGVTPQIGGGNNMALGGYQGGRLDNNTLLRINSGHLRSDGSTWNLPPAQQGSDRGSAMNDADRAYLTSRTRFDESGKPAGLLPVSPGSEQYEKSQAAKSLFNAGYDRNHGGTLEQRQEAYGARQAARNQMDLARAANARGPLEDRLLSPRQARYTRKREEQQSAYEQGLGFRSPGAYAALQTGRGAQQIAAQRDRDNALLRRDEITQRGEIAKGEQTTRANIAKGRDDTILGTAKSRDAIMADELELRRATNAAELQQRIEAEKIRAEAQVESAKQRALGQSPELAAKPDAAREPTVDDLRASANPANDYASLRDKHGPAKAVQMMNEAHGTNHDWERYPEGPGMFRGSTPPPGSAPAANPQAQPTTPSLFRRREEANRLRREAGQMAGQYGLGLG